MCLKYMLLYMLSPTGKCISVSKLRLYAEIIHHAVRWNARILGKIDINLMCDKDEVREIQGTILPELLSRENPVTHGILYEKKEKKTVIIIRFELL